MPRAIATNHQSGNTTPDRAPFTRTYERHAHLSALGSDARNLHASFAKEPLLQDRYTEGFGTLFTAEYDPMARSLRLIWPHEDWCQSLTQFEEGQRVISYGLADQRDPDVDWNDGIDWSRAAQVDWVRVGRDYAMGKGQPVDTYLSELHRL